MPTGYTSDIHAGKKVSLSDFATTCARGFGAFIHQREGGLGAALTYPDPPDHDGHHAEALADATAEKNRWDAYTEEQKYALWSKNYKDATVRRHEALAESAALRGRYQSMLAKVHATEVPAELENFKNFMIEQLESSIRYDCGEDDSFISDYYRPLEYVEWCEGKEAGIVRDIDYHLGCLQREQERHEQARVFIDLLCKSFGVKVHNHATA